MKKRTNEQLMTAVEKFKSIKDDSASSQKGLLCITKHAYKSIEQYKEQIIKMEEKISEKETLVRESFIPIVRNIYSKWIPSLGEKVALIDFGEDFFMELEISDINGTRLKAKESERCFHRFNLDLKSEDYFTTTFIVPAEFYNQIKNKFSFKQF